MPDTSKTETPKPKKAASNSKSQRATQPATDVPFPEQGHGGEVHQQAENQSERLTTAQGVTISDNQNTLKAGASGPALLEDFVMREKIFHFDHERIPERVVHARGYGAHGVFECTKAIPELTMAAPFQEVGKTTEVFTRFSTVAGSKGSADLARDVRGFAVKFYTNQGNWDLVGNNMPVFFIQDAMKFPDLVHAVKPEPDTGFPQAQSAHDNFWDFISLTPESMHMVMWTMSDRAIPRSFSTMEGFGVHTFRFINSEGKSTFVKFHWKPKLGLQSKVWNEALKTNGADPDRHRRIMWEEIDTGNAPRWDLAVQTFDQEFADSFDFDVLDPTKLIPEEVIKPEIIGTMTLNRNVDNFFAETEQVAFCTQNVVPGIDFTDDPLLQGRNFSYLDTQIKRLGSPNFTKIPVNRPKGCPVHNYQQDGHMQTSARAGRVNYEPNGWEEGPREHPLEGYVSYRQPIEGDKQRLRPESFADHYSQARQFYISQTEVEQQHIQAALVFELSKCEMLGIRRRIVSHLLNIDQTLAEGVADGLGIEDLPKAAPAAQQPRTDLDPSPALSIVKNGPDSFAGRTLGVLASDGADAATLTALKDAAAAEGVMIKLIAPKIGGFTDSNGDKHPADEKVDGGPSVLFDAVAIILGDATSKAVAAMPPAQDFLKDAFVHCKFIATAAPSARLVEACGLTDKLDDGCVSLTDKASAAAFIKRCADLRYWDREAALWPA
ncbi:catalase [Pseudoruegeria sp. SK021]|uniref:catalase n=1 Tax=Pseudoruegeria sp. SK021 TaxID=1933035 RepID=UPI000A24BCE2|nr:catalase [Pseudoruegeria sp. SK021]OSP54382.1 catalase HPII [Pseudoruegeria sp. SK021]